MHCIVARHASASAERRWRRDTILWVVAAVASVSVVFSVAVVALAMRGAGRPTLEERYKRAWATYVRDTDAFPRCPAIGQHSRTDNGMECNVKAGDRLQVRHGPFLADTLVVEITDRGAIIDYTGKVTLVGYTSMVPAPDGTPLPETPTQGFIGRAHLATRPVPGIYAWAADDKQPAPANIELATDNPAAPGPNAQGAADVVTD